MQAQRESKGTKLKEPEDVGKSRASMWLEMSRKNDIELER